MVARAAACENDGFDGVVIVEDDVDGGCADADGIVMDFLHGGVSVKRVKKTTNYQIHIIIYNEKKTRFLLGLSLILKTVTLLFLLIYYD